MSRSGVVFIFGKHCVVCNDFALFVCIDGNGTGSSHETHRKQNSERDISCSRIDGEDRKKRKKLIKVNWSSGNVIIYLFYALMNDIDEPTGSRPLFMPVWTRGHQSQQTQSPLLFFLQFFSLPIPLFFFSRNFGGMGAVETVAGRYDWCYKMWQRTEQCFCFSRFHQTENIPSILVDPVIQSPFDLWCIVCDAKAIDICQRCAVHSTRQI